MGKNIIFGFNEFIETNNLVENDWIHSSKILKAYDTSPFLIAAERVFVDNVIGSELEIQPTPNHHFLNVSKEEIQTWIKDTSHRWRLWSTNNTFYETQAMQYRTYKVLGLCVSLFSSNDNDELTIINVDPAAIDVTAGFDSGFSAGIKTNESNAVTHLAIRTNTNERKILKATGDNFRKNFVFFSPAKLAGQKKGKSVFSNLTSLVFSIIKFIEFQVEASKINSSLLGYVKGDGVPDGNRVVSGATTNIKNTDGSKETVSIAKSGTMARLNEGENIEMFDTKRATPEMMDFVKTIAVLIGMYTGISGSYILKQFEKSYSASRAETQESWKTFTNERRSFEKGFLNVVYQQWLRKEIISGRIVAEGFFDTVEKQRAWSQCVWHGVTQPSIDPLKQAKADQVLSELGVVSKSTLARKYGTDYFVELEKIKQEQETRKELELEEQEIKEQEDDLSGE